MKISAVLSLLLVLGVGCAAQIDDRAQAELDADAATPYDPEEDAVEVGVTSQALQSPTVGATDTRPWCAARKTCYDQCDKDYSRSPGPLATCKQLCDKTTASKCRTIAGGVYGAVIF